MGVGETGQFIGETGVGETGVGEMGVILQDLSYQFSPNINISLQIKHISYFSFC